MCMMFMFILNLINDPVIEITYACIRYYFYIKKHAKMNGTFDVVYLYGLVNKNRINAVFARGTLNAWERKWIAS